MIEILCIAAEITAVLLILSIAIPASATKHAAKLGVVDHSNVDSELLHECEESLLALRSLLYLQTSQSVASKSRERACSESHTEVLHRLRDHLDVIEPLQVSSTIDSVTKLPNRRELEKLLEASTQWAPLVDVPTWIGLLQVDNLDQLDDEHGPMASELMLREVASFLRDRIGGLGPLVRFNHGSFAVALHGWSQVAAVEFLESIRVEIRDLTSTIGESTIFSTASASATELDVTIGVDAHWERLEDGIVEAISKGANRGRWFDAADSTWRPMGAESEEDSAHESEEDVVSNREDDEVTETDLSDDVQPASAASNPIQADSPTSPTHTSENASSTTPATESAADAIDSDDIAMLFKAAQSNKQRQPAVPKKPTESTPQPASSAPPTKVEATPDEVPDVNDIQNDIAALFKAARAFNGPSVLGDVESDLSKSVKKSVAEDAPVEASPATNDDIESLFAAFKKPK